MKGSVPLLLFAVCSWLALPSPVAAQDGTPSCLRRASQVIELAGDHGFEQLHWFAPADGTAFDARGARWQFQTYPVPRSADPVRITGGGQDACFVGGLIEGTNPASAGWAEIYQQSNGAAFAFGGDQPLRNFVLDGIRIDNVWDGIRPRAHADNFVIRNVWVSDARDDCIENDHYITGVVEDSLLDGCHMAISARNPRDPESYGARVLTIEHSLIRLKPFPKPRQAMLRRHPWARDPGHGMFFKWSPYSMKVRLHDNVFMLEQLPNNARWAIEVPPAISCSNNVLVWLGQGDPGPVPDCFAVVRDRSVWERVRAAWIARHPEVMRARHDPLSERAPKVAGLVQTEWSPEHAACRAQAGVLACAGAACHCVPHTVGTSSTSGTDVTVSGTVLDVDTSSVGGPWEVTVDADESGTIEVVIPSGNPRCVAEWDLDQIKSYRPGDRITARGFVFGTDRVRVCMAPSHYVTKGGTQ